MSSDPLRPHHDPARSIFDAFMAEAKHRNIRTLDEWIAAERQAVWRAARDWAQQHGRPVLTLAQIESAERSACGHVDYAATWAYGVAKQIQNMPAGAGGERTS